MSAAFQKRSLSGAPLITFHYSFIQNQKSCTKLENRITLYLCFVLLIKGALRFSSVILISLYEKCLHVLLK